MAKSKRLVIKLTTPVFRAGFTQGVFEARAAEEGAAKKFGLTAIWDPSTFTAKDDKLWAEMKKALNEVCMKQFGESWDDLCASGGNFRRGLRDGNEPKKRNMDGFGKGKFFASLTSKFQPGVVDVKKATISPEEGNEDEVYSGCYMRATVGIYAFDNKGQGVAIGLNNLQKIRDGERLDGRGEAADDFEDDIDESWLDQQEEPADVATEFEDKEDDL